MTDFIGEMSQQAMDQRTRTEILDQPRSIRETIVREYSKLEQIAGEIVRKRKIERMLIVAMGSSYSSALIGKTLARSLTSLPIEIFRGYEFEFEEPIGLNEKSCILLISFSGETEDVVSALRLAKKKGCYVISISGPEENTLARESNDAIRIISADTKAMVAAHLSQIALIYLLVALIAKYRDGVTERAEELRSQMNDIIFNLDGVISQYEKKCAEIAEEFKSDEIFYVISAGPNFGLAYKFAMTELTENDWVHGVVQYSTEFRHGIIEKIEPSLPMIFLVGTDPSRKDILRELETCKKLGARIITWDALDFPKTDPFLTPFYLAIPTEWFAYHLSLKRGRMPSDRRYMGPIIPYANMKSLTTESHKLQ